VLLGQPVSQVSEVAGRAPLIETAWMIRKPQPGSYRGRHGRYQHCAQSGPEILAIGVLRSQPIQFPVEPLRRPLQGSQ
jgi:hypothetical protein